MTIEKFLSGGDHPRRVEVRDHVNGVRVTLFDAYREVSCATAPTLEAGFSEAYSRFEVGLSDLLESDVRAARAEYKVAADRLAVARERVRRLAAGK